MSNPIAADDAPDAGTLADAITENQAEVFHAETMPYAEAHKKPEQDDALPETASCSALQLIGVDRAYVQGDERLEILRSVDLTLYPGEAVALIAPSGAGKSTLLHVAGLLEKPDAGEIIIGGDATATMTDAGRTMLRQTSIGFIYQFHQLLPEFTALENVMLPQMIAGLSKQEAALRANELLAYLGLSQRTTHLPSQLSGGEQQRVAIARAMANAPHVLLADEPTGNLDPKTAEHVFETLMTLTQATGVAAIIATHNLHLAERMDRRITLREGKVVDADVGDRM